jgi:hypothetical protein
MSAYVPGSQVMKQSWTEAAPVTPKPVVVPAGQGVCLPSLPPGQ